MGDPNDPDFQKFVLHVLNTSFSSNVNDDCFDSDMDVDDFIINNIPNISDSEDEFESENVTSHVSPPTHYDIQPSTSAGITYDPMTSQSSPQRPDIAAQPHSTPIRPTTPLHTQGQNMNPVTPPLLVPVTQPNTDTVTIPHPVHIVQAQRGQVDRRHGRGDKRRRQPGARPQPPHWDNVTVNDPGPTATLPLFNVNKGPVLPSTIDIDSEPIDYFSLFFNEDIIQLICTETNFLQTTNWPMNIPLKLASPNGKT